MSQQSTEGGAKSPKRESFEFKLSYDAGGDKRECSLSIRSGHYNSLNSWDIEEVDMESMVKMINIMSSKYSQIR
jgi:hypothetical protein